jgi:hypothetical protein
LPIQLVDDEEKDNGNEFSDLLHGFCLAPAVTMVD